MSTINATIGYKNLDDASEIDAGRFASAVKLELENTYPDATINMEIDWEGTGSVKVRDFDDDEAVEQNVKEIISTVWARKDW